MTIFDPYNKNGAPSHADGAEIKTGAHDREDVRGGVETPQNVRCNRQNNNLDAQNGEHSDQEHGDDHRDGVQSNGSDAQDTFEKTSPQDAGPHAVEAPRTAPPRPLADSPFWMPLVQGDTYASLPVFPDGKNPGALKWFPPPAKSQEAQPLIDFLRKNNHPSDAVALQQRAVSAEEARRALDRLQSHLAKGLEQWQAHAKEHNQLLAPHLHFERERLAPLERAAGEDGVKAAALCARAGLPFPCEEVIATLKQSVPSEETLYGKQGMVRFPLPQSTRFIDIASCLSCGFLTLVVGLGPILDVFHLEMLDDLALTWPRLAVGTALGTTVVFCLGAAAQQITTQLATRILERKAGEPPSSVKRAAKIAIPVVVGTALLLLVTCEITVGATGCSAPPARANARSYSPTPL